MKNQRWDLRYETIAQRIEVASFIHRGVNGRWHDELLAEDVAAYEAKVLAELPPECADWLANGTQRDAAAPVAA